MGRVASLFLTCVVLVIVGWAIGTLLGWAVTVLLL